MRKLKAFDLVVSQSLYDVIVCLRITLCYIDAVKRCAESVEQSKTNGKRTCITARHPYFNTPVHSRLDVSGLSSRDIQSVTPVSIEVMKSCAKDDEQ